MFNNVNTRRKVKMLLSLLILAALFTSLTSSCGNRNKVYRVGILAGLDYFANIADGFTSEMAELGYIEGQNIIYDIHQPNDVTAYKSILEKFVADEVDLIFVFPTEASVDAKAITQGTDTPMLFAAAFVEGNNLIESMREPGGNITGVRYPSPDLAAKSLEILLEIEPQAQRVWIPYLQGYLNVPSQFEAIYPTAAALGVTLEEFPVASLEEFHVELQARTEAADPGIDAMLLMYEPLTTWLYGDPAIAEFANKHHIAVGGHDILFTLIIDNTQTGKQAASMADKILRGTPAGTIPVASSESFLTINYKGAQEAGVTVPEGLLRQADEIIR